jgi:uncharacterized protein YcaQ
MSDPRIDQLRRYAIARSLFAPTNLNRAIEQLGFLQADPIRAPARAQDLILRHRVKNYRAGDLERRYAELDVEEDFFVNYGFVPRALYALMHPRRGHRKWNATALRRSRDLLTFIRERGHVHPREVEKHFAHGTVTNYWGGSSNATTHLLDAMHYRGLLRVVRRDQGVRVYAAQEHPTVARGTVDPELRLDAMIDVVVGTYAPLPGASLANLVGRLRFGVPQWRDRIPAALARAKGRLAQARIDGVMWYWPSQERIARRSSKHIEQLRLLAPFDPIVWDRRRFELFWGWPYRFEAYTPAVKRKYGYYALPLLWREEVVGWGNLSLHAGQLDCQLGFVSKRPRDAAFSGALDAELARLRAFLS